MITSSYTHIYIYIVQRLSLNIVTVYLVISKTQRSRIVQKVFVLQNQIVARLTKQNKTFIFHYEIEIINNRLLATKDFVPHLNDLRYAYNYRFQCVISKDLYTWFWFRSGPVYVVTHSDLTLNFQSKIQHRQA